MSEEKQEEIKGLKFTTNDGGAGKEVLPEPVVENTEEEKDAITNTKSRTSRKG